MCAFLLPPGIKGLKDKPLNNLFLKRQPEVLYKKAALKNLAIFTGKDLC